MDAEDKKLLEETYKLSLENNSMLHKVRSVQKWASFWQGVKLLVIIGITLGSFYYIEPYLDKLLSLYNSVSGTQQKLNSESLKGLLKNVGN